MKRLILTGIFRNDDAAKAAINSLERAGKKRDEIAALFADHTAGLAFRIREKTKSSEGAALGALLGIIVGGVIALLIALSDVTLTAVGALAYINPVIACLAGAGAGAIIAGTAGAIIGRGIPEHEAKVTQGNIKSGNILLAVTADEDKREEIEHILRATGGKHLTAADRKFENEAGSREISGTTPEPHSPASR